MVDNDNNADEHSLISMDLALEPSAEVVTSTPPEHMELCETERIPCKDGFEGSREAVPVDLASDTRRLQTEEIGITYSEC